MSLSSQSLLRKILKSYNMSWDVLKKMTKVGFTCGAFDLLHAGHALMFKECKDHCNYLVVGLQKDPSFDRPDKNKPIQSLEERFTMLNSIRWIDEIVIYKTEDDLYQLLKTQVAGKDINVRIIGEDWKGKEFTGHDLDVDVVYNSRDHGYSTSDLRERVYLAEKRRRDDELSSS